MKLLAALITFFTFILPAYAESDGDFIHNMMERQIRYYDELGKKVYDSQMEFYSSHHDEVCRMMDQSCPPANRMQGFAIAAAKTRLSKLMKVAEDDLVTKMGGDANSRKKAADIFGAVQGFVFEDMDKLDR